MTNKITKNTHGGARKGAGRPSAGEPLKQVNVLIPESVAKKFKELGARKWLIEQVNAEQKKPAGLTNEQAEFLLTLEAQIIARRGKVTKQVEELRRLFF